MSIFTGAGVAIVTPMKANGEINYDKLAELLDYQINNSNNSVLYQISLVSIIISSYSN